MTKDELTQFVKRQLQIKYFKKGVFISDLELTFDEAKPNKISVSVEFYKDKDKDDKPALISMNFEFDVTLFLIDRLSEEIENHKFIRWESDDGEDIR